MAKVEIEFKDPDFDSALVQSGVSEAAALKIRSKAGFGEYYVLELTLDTDGYITAAKFKKVRS